MLISLEKLCSKYHVQMSGVLHIGAHEAEERDLYLACKAEKILWIEAIPELATRIEELISEHPLPFTGEKVINATVSDRDGDEVQFNITSNDGESSSLLELGSHKSDYPNVRVVKKIRAITQRVDTLFQQYPEEFAGLDFVTLDIQGVELAAIRGFGTLLPRFKWLYIEVSRKEVYVGSGMIWEIDRLLLRSGYFRQETIFTKGGWGEAFYEKYPAKVNGIFFSTEPNNTLNIYAGHWKTPRYLKTQLRS